LSTLNKEHDYDELNAYEPHENISQAQVTISCDREVLGLGNN